MFGRKVLSKRTILGVTKYTFSTPIRKTLCTRYNQENLMQYATSNIKKTSLIIPQQQLIRNIHTGSALLKEETVNAPTFPDSVSSGDVKLIKKEGDNVAMDEVIMEIETDKTALPVMCPGHGTLTKILVKQGQSVKSGQPLFQVSLLLRRYLHYR
ncbi:hypothetical protein PYW07_008061 [Mythimna separata]|uniref:Lipoyl-binding domain-containing protein n=1 Tax=Mythimna separata TaxID=271217 RepID=A0AAD8DUE3_MYTSE|nr:hypothetical protein PYW07_008061 [Mythimna separata]